MAGIYIRGLEIPKVPTLFIIFSDGRVENEDDSAYKYSAIPVPDHGDLIDRDKAVHELAFDYAYAAADVVKKLPAVIPADREGEA